MSLVLSQAHQEARHRGSLSHLDSGTGNVRIRVYDGIPPTTGAVTSNLLVEILLDKPSGSIGNGILTLLSSSINLVSNSGTATWARVITSAGDIAFDLSVSDMTGSGDLKLISTTL